MKTEFKIGDRVRLTDDNNGYGKKGAEGVIKRLPSLAGSHSYEVLFDEPFRGCRDWFSADNAERTTNLELVTPTPSKRYAAENDHVIMLCKDGNYLPSTTPRVMSRAQALSVAKTMSKKHGGKFVVFKAVAHAVAPEVVEPTVIEFN